MLLLLLLIFFFIFFKLIILYFLVKILQKPEYKTSVKYSRKKTKDVSINNANFQQNSLTIQQFTANGLNPGVSVVC